MLEPGDRAPAFTLEGDDGKTHTLKEFSGKTLILYFYPRDNTPGCTVEACEFRDAAPKYKKRDAVIVGVSPDSVASHGKFRDKQKLNFLLLADPDHAVAEKYGAWGDKVLYGRKFKGIIRSTFVIDGKGRIVEARHKVSPKGHANDLLGAL
jgi:thioredoxin-dependent peroxiredoxin